MHSFKKLFFSLLSCSVLLLTACNDNNPAEIEKVDNPETVAIAFFNALYNEKNVEKAASVCSPKLAKLIRHYRSAPAVGRHLFNMSFDNVVVTPDKEGVKLREQFKGSAKITVYFKGTYNGGLIRDVKELYIVQRDDKWFIEKLLKDPF